MRLGSDGIFVPATVDRCSGNVGIGLDARLNSVNVFWMSASLCDCKLWRGGFKCMRSGIFRRGLEYGGSGRSLKWRKMGFVRSHLENRKQGRAKKEGSRNFKMVGKKQDSGQSRVSLSLTRKQQQITIMLRVVCFYFTQILFCSVPRKPSNRVSSKYPGEVRAQHT